MVLLIVMISEVIAESQLHGVFYKFLRDLFVQLAAFSASI